MKLVFLFLGLAAVLPAASITLHVSVDSSGIGTVPGYIEFQFNQAPSGDSLPATANIANFTSSGFTFDNLSNFSLGGVSGSLSSPPLVFDNTVGAANLFDQGVAIFGNSFSFDVTLAGSALNTTANDGSAFFVLLLDTNFNPLTANDGQVASIVINGDTSVTNNPTSLSTITAASSVPEPATFAMTLAGAMLLGLARFASAANVNRRK